MVLRFFWTLAWQKHAGENPAPWIWANRILFVLALSAAGGCVGFPSPVEATNSIVLIRIQAARGGYFTVVNTQTQQTEFWPVSKTGWASRNVLPGKYLLSALCNEGPRPVAPYPWTTTAWSREVRLTLVVPRGGAAFYFGTLIRAEDGNWASRNAIDQEAKDTYGKLFPDVSRPLEQGESTMEFPKSTHL